MAMCVSVSGGVRTTKSFRVSMDQPAGTLKVAPAEVTRGVSAVTRSMAGLVSAAWGDAARLKPAKTLKARQITKAVRNTVVRCVDIQVPQTEKMPALRDHDTRSRLACKTCRKDNCGSN